MEGRGSSAPDGAAVTDIKARFKELVKRHHPDVNGGNRISEDKLREIIEAYNHLKKTGFCRIGARSDSLPTGKITRNSSNSRHFGPPFGKASVDSLGNSNALRQIPCSIRNPECFRPNRELIHRNREFTAIGFIVPFTIRHRPVFE